MVTIRPTLYPVSAVSSSYSLTTACLIPIILVIQAKIRTAASNQERLIPLARHLPPSCHCCSPIIRQDFGGFRPYFSLLRKSALVPFVYTICTIFFSWCEWCFRCRCCMVRLYWARDKIALMRWILVWNMPQVQAWSLVVDFQSGLLPLCYDCISSNRTRLKN